MPENEFPKLTPHPFRAPKQPPAPPQPADASPPPPYAELCVTSNYTFLTGASHPEEFVRQAAALGYTAVAITDTHTLAGVVRAHVAAKDANLRFVLGSRLRLSDMPGVSLCVYPIDMDGYRHLCRLLTTGKRRAPKGERHLTFADLTAYATNLLAIAIPDDDTPEPIRNALARLIPLFDDDRLSLATHCRYDGLDHQRLLDRAALAESLAVPLVAINDAHHHTPDRRMLQDILTCIRHGCTLSSAGYRLHANAERHLKAPHEMHRLFADYPQALNRAQQVVERTRGFSLDQLRYEYPDEVVPSGRTPIQHLTDLVWEGAAIRYPTGVPAKVIAHIHHELSLIDDLNYARYFLTVHDLVRYARSLTPPILCQGRGAAANSAVCYCLGVTAVDPDRIDVLFERFISKERNEPPDIDIDFEHQRREEVIQYIYAKYGRERAALTAEVISYRRRSAVRDVGKALGLSLDAVDRLAKDLEWWDQTGINPERLKAAGFEPTDPTMQWLVKLTGEILGFPRHLSQHVGGFIITRSPLCELVPIENAAMPDRTIVEWDKDDIDAVGMLKVDVLGLGMLSCIRRALELVSAKLGKEIDLATIPPECPATYEMIQRADTVGVFQIESRAQMSMLPRLKPACFYDLVIEVAIVRPGPIQGDMVHPYLRRRRGEEAVSYPHPSVEKVLKKTLGVPLFQEQCMALAVHAAGFTPGQADQLRRAMAAWKRKGDQIYRFGQQLIEGMIAKGIDEAFARQCFEQIKGFSEYGFPESHAASFALLVYASCWLKHHHPAEFAAALLNSQPMGFYAPAQIIQDAQRHGVIVLPVDVNFSQWDCTVHNNHLRLGTRMVLGLGKPDAIKIEQAVRAHGPIKSLLTLWRVSGAKAAAIRRLATADAFGSLGLSRQKAQWDAKLLRDQPMPLFDGLEEQMGPTEREDHQAGSSAAAEASCLPQLTPTKQVVLDYATTGLSLKGHPVAFARAKLNRLGAVPCNALPDPDKVAEGETVTIGGLVLVRQRPGTAGGVTFITLEDETGPANLIIWQRIYQRDRTHARSHFILAEGTVQREGLVTHLIVSRIRSFDAETKGLLVTARNFR